MKAAEPLFLGKKGEEDFNLFRHHLAISKQFELYLVTSPSVFVLEEICRRLQSSPPENLDFETLDYENPNAAANLISDMYSMAEKHANRTIFWVAIRGPEQEIQATWKNQLHRLNERRNNFLESFKHAFILSGPKWLIETMADAAPDLWSIRSRVFRFPYIPKMEYEEREILRQQTTSYDVTEPPQYYEELAEELRGSRRESDQQARASLLADAGRAWLKEYNLEKAEPIFNQAYKLFTQIKETTKANITILELIECYYFLSDYQKAEEWLAKIDNDIVRENDPNATAEYLLQKSRLLIIRGEVDIALSNLYQAKELGTNERDRSIIIGEIARILKNKGDVEQAMKLHQELLKVYEQLGDKRSRAVTLGKIARILTDKGDVEQAMKMHQERLKVYEQLGDKRSRAITLGDIAGILKNKGDVEQAMQLHQEELVIYEQLGDKRSRAVTLGEIARILTDKGDVEQAMKLHQERLKVYEQLGDKRSRAVTLGDIARILTNRGDIEQAMKLHQEELAIYEQLGDKRSRAVTLGDIARILTDQGNIEQAIKLHQERLIAYEQLGDMDGKANALWSMAQTELEQKKLQKAHDHLAESYAILQKIGRLDGICMVGVDLGKLLCAAGQKESGLEMLAHSRDGFVKLQRLDYAEKVQQVIDHFSKEDD